MKTHDYLMKGLIESAWKYRAKGAGIVKGNKVEHVTPPYKNVSFLMKNLFVYLNDKVELTLIKSCVFHYEMEFVHPFIDGNDRMGRLWQTLILMKEYPVFEFLPFETLISQTQTEYYKSLTLNDKNGKSTIFIENVLDLINKSLKSLLSFNNRILNNIDRLEYFINKGAKEFTRKDYMNKYKDLSSATKTRDLKKGIDLHLFVSKGKLNRTRYTIK